MMLWFKKGRKGKSKRKTQETDISVNINIDGKGASDIETGIGFLNHMLTLLAKHGLFDLSVKVKKSDLDVDIHHTNEDVGIGLGEAINDALGNKKGIKRFGRRDVPMGDDLVKAVVDISGRPKLRIDTPTGYQLQAKDVNYSLRDAEQFLEAFVTHSKITLHIDILHATDLHHTLEALFKALAGALDEATQIDKRVKGIPTTKGKL